MSPLARSARNVLVLALGLFAVAILLARHPALPDTTTPPTLMQR